MLHAEWKSAAFCKFMKRSQEVKVKEFRLIDVNLHHRNCSSWQAYNVNLSSEAERVKPDFSMQISPCMYVSTIDNWWENGVQLGWLSDSDLCSLSEDTQLQYLLINWKCFRIYYSLFLDILAVCLIIWNYLHLPFLKGCRLEKGRNVPILCSHWKKKINKTGWHQG